MKVSILSAVYNEIDHIDAMITSVQAQTHGDWELLFVDDGSTDGTPDRIAQYAQSDERIKLVSRGEKIGKVAAFNRAHTASDGDILVLLAGDDQLPVNSLAIRHAALASHAAQLPCVAFFKIRTFSSDKKFDGMVLPRGRGANRSGGALAMNRELADMLFPIDESLISEDIWVAYGSVDLAAIVLERPDVVLHYRIHPGNSNPRNRPFSEMTESMHARHGAWLALLRSSQFVLTPETRIRLFELWKAEERRYAGKPMSVARCRLPLVERAAMLSMTSPALFAIRTRFYKTFSGRRS